MASEAGISRRDLKHCELTFWIPPALQFGQIKILIDIQTVPLSPLMKFSRNFIEMTPLPIFLVALERQRGSNSDTFCS